jgi:hypothetical protein
MGSGVDKPKEFKAFEELLRRVVKPSPKPSVSRPVPSGKG